jgi:aspartokinase-like uncharacterized kinase
MLRVVKVGGSLLDWAGLPAALSKWLNQQPPGMNVLVSGGGKLAECIRDADQRFSLGDEPAHWLAVDCLSITSRLLAVAGDFSSFLDRYDDLLAWRATSALGNVVLDAREYLRQFEATLPGVPLPRDWTATSDSIAARLAETIGADELCLLKSSPPPRASLTELSASGYVDQHFSVAAARLPAPRFIDLRAWM